MCAQSTLSLAFVKWALNVLTAASDEVSPRAAPPKARRVAAVHRMGSENSCCILRDSLSLVVGICKPPLVQIVLPVESLVSTTLFSYPSLFLLLFYIF